MFGLITQRQNIDQYGFECDSLESTYINYFTSIGVEPLLISNFQNPNLFSAELLILTGGGSVKSEYFNSPHNDYVQDKRDFLEQELFRLATKNNIPILAICRGFQYVNGLLGGKITRPEKLHAQRPIREDHEVQMKAGIIQVNNFHNDVIFENDLAKNLFVVAKDEPNSIIEAFYSKDLKILGLQWHPERAFVDDKSKKYSAEIILNFIQNKGVLDESYYFSCR